MGLFFYLLDNISTDSRVLHKLLLFCLSIFIYSLIYCFLFNKGDFNYNTNYKKKYISISDKFLEMLYFSSITQSTVGFGDISPKTRKAKIIVVVQILTSFILLSL